MKGVIDDKQYIKIIDYIVKQLQEDDVKYDDVIRNTLLKLVQKAEKNNLYSLEVEGMKNYAKDIAMKLEIQLMLDGGECILNEDVERLYRELLGNLPDEGPDRKSVV